MKTRADYEIVEHYPDVLAADLLGFGLILAGGGLGARALFTGDFPTLPTAAGVFAVGSVLGLWADIVYETRPPLNQKRGL